MVTVHFGFNRMKGEIGELERLEKSDAAFVSLKLTSSTKAGLELPRDDARKLRDALNAFLGER